MVRLRLRTGALIALGFVLLWGALGGPAQAQSALEEWAKQQISEKTGIDPHLLATLFVTDGSDQFLIAFVYLTEEVLQSDLKPELKEAVAPYVGQRALLALVVPTRTSYFSPLEISFAQDGFVYLLGHDQIHPITEDFRPGTLEANVVSAGVLLLPPGLDESRPFEIRYRGGFSTLLSLQGRPDPRRPGGGAGAALRLPPLPPTDPAAPVPLPVPDRDLGRLRRSPAP
jgi:hypothetical protein